MKKLWRFLSKGWLKFAALLAWVNTRILLIIIFFLVISPIALIGRIFGKRFLQIKLDEQAKTYWEERPEIPFKKEKYFQQF